MKEEMEILKALKRQEKMMGEILQGFYSLTSNVAWLVGVLKAGDGEAAEDDDSELGIPGVDQLPAEPQLRCS